MVLKLSERSDFRRFGPVDDLRALDALVRAKSADHSPFYDLGGAQVGFAPPVHVRESVNAALQEGRTGYTEAIGTPAIRNAIAEYYTRQYGLPLTGDRVAVTTGSAGGLVLALLCFFSPGERIGIAVPGAPEHRRALQALGLVPVDIRTGAEDGFQLNTAALDAQAGQIDGLIVTNPSNPAGGVMAADDLRALAGWASARGVRLLVDETGHGLGCGPDGGGAPPMESILSYSDDAVVIGSFSRRFAMPGWRIGWLVLPADNVRTIECLSQSLTVSPPTLPQFAGVEALEHRAAMDEAIARLDGNRALACEKLAAAGFGVMGDRQAGLHMWLRLPEDQPDSIAFCTALLAATGVYLRPGVAFDADEGQRYVRLSYGAEPAEFAAAIDAVTTWMEG